MIHHESLEMYDISKDSMQFCSLKYSFIAITYEQLVLQMIQVPVTGHYYSQLLILLWTYWWFASAAAVYS